MSNQEIKKLHQDFLGTSKNALNKNWTISPLDYFWADGKKLFDKVFAHDSKDELDDCIIPILYKMTMQCDFRAKMMVLCYMKEPVISKFSLEIENGLLHFYGLDFISTISQWIYVFEGILRDMFGLSKQKEIVEHNKWNIPIAKDSTYQDLMDVFIDSIKNFTKNVLFQSNEDFQTTSINRHLLSHGKVYNKDFFSQTNCLKLLFSLDTLLMIELLKNGNFPKVFDTTEEEKIMINKRINLYSSSLSTVFSVHNLLKVEVIKEHLSKSTKEVLND